MTGKRHQSACLFALFLPRWCGVGPFEASAEQDDRSAGLDQEVRSHIHVVERALSTAPVCQRAGMTGQGLGLVMLCDKWCGLAGWRCVHVWRKGFCSSKGIREGLRGLNDRLERGKGRLARGSYTMNASRGSNQHQEIKHTNKNHTDLQTRGSSKGGQKKEAAESLGCKSRPRCVPGGVRRSAAGDSLRGIGA